MRSSLCIRALMRACYQRMNMEESTQTQMRESIFARSDIVKAKGKRNAPSKETWITHRNNYQSWVWFSRIDSFDVSCSNRTIQGLLVVDGTIVSTTHTKTCEDKFNGIITCVKESEWLSWVQLLLFNDTERMFLINVLTS